MKTCLESDYGAGRMKKNLTAASVGPSPALVDLANEFERRFVELGIEPDEQFGSRASVAAFVEAVILAHSNKENAQRLAVEIASALLADPENLAVFGLLISVKCDGEGDVFKMLREILDAVWVSLESNTGVTPECPPITSRILLFFGLGLALTDLKPAAAKVIIGQLKSSKCHINRRFFE